LALAPVPFLLEEEDGGKIKCIEGVIGDITYET
jgi:hypothetical protein